ncbi:MAG TPA: hypothetical protein VMW17_05480 [Candidatus Binatia bacterium]|nr:hypothetical protein [Candidatus Binatia bacterium]
MHHTPDQLASAHDHSVPHIGLFGLGFFSRQNLAVGWAVGWRVSLLNGFISGALQGALALARGGVLFDLVDRLLLFVTTTVAGLLVTDWVCRRVARLRYGLAIDHFVGISMMWWELIASIVWGGILALLLAAGLVVIQIGTAEPMRARLTIGWVLLLAPFGIAAALAGMGWAAHTVFRAEPPITSAPSASTWIDGAPVPRAGELPPH